MSVNRNVSAHSGWVHQMASIVIIFRSYHMPLGSLASSNKPRDSLAFSLLSSSLTVCRFQVRKDQDQALTPPLTASCS